jgi:hypothetical protein
MKAMADFSLKACMESVEFEVEVLHCNVFEEYGRALVRAKQDVFFNKTMIKAYEQYIADHGLSWDAKVGK